ncbi:hypothetical protein, partial [Xenorhabdus bharatensis]|uniref:hypothetical protein n=1 Tax=Xenorhabdus bharatensis TaxID=3136256 RepID=UPI0030F3AE12
MSTGSPATVCPRTDPCELNGDWRAVRCTGVSVWRPAFRWHGLSRSLTLILSDYHALPGVSVDALLSGV